MFHRSKMKEKKTDVKIKSGAYKEKLFALLVINKL